MRSTPVGRDELLARVKGGETMVIDVRPATEYQAGHIPGAVTFPVDELPQHLDTLPHGQEIVALLSRTLLHAGFRGGGQAARSGLPGAPAGRRFFPSGRRKPACRYGNSATAGLIAGPTFFHPPQNFWLTRGSFVPTIQALV